MPAGLEGRLPPPPLLTPAGRNLVPWPHLVVKEAGELVCSRKGCLPSTTLGHSRTEPKQASEYKEKHKNLGLYGVCLPSPCLQGGTCHPDEGSLVSRSLQRPPLGSVPVQRAPMLKVPGSPYAVPGQRNGVLRFQLDG